MGVHQPFMYDAIKTEGHGSPYHEFDPKRISRESMAPKPRPMKKPEGPLVSFNQHPDSYLILPLGNSNAKAMNPSVKKWIKWMRIAQLVLRSLEVIAACGLLVMMILISGVDVTTGWIMRIVPGAALLHTVYAIYHLGRKPSGRTPASSASYMLFASFFDVSIIPFYAFSALVAMTRQSAWKTLLSNQNLTPIFTSVVFYLASIGGGLHLVSLTISLYLAVTFRKITKLPPDMNPLEDNLTSRHKRSKSSLSTVTTVSEKRLSTPLENKRSSGAPYEDLARPPTIPFFHTRTQSTDSFSTYRSTPPPSRDARLDLPSRQYQIVPNPTSARSSLAGSELKRSSQYTPSSPAKRGSYTEVPMSDITPHRSSRFVENTKPTDPWYVSDSLGKSRGRSSSPRKTPAPGQTKYEPLHQRHNSSDDISIAHPNPLNSNPSTPPSAPRHGHKYNASRDSPLSEISNINISNRYSGDIADQSGLVRELTPAPLRDFKAKGYGDLRAATPPILIGGKSDRHVSGNDFGYIAQAGYRREVSGKVAEEGRGDRTFGARLRKISGL